MSTSLHTEVLHNAARTIYDKNILELFISSVSELNNVDSDGNTAINLAAKYGNFTLFKSLVEKDVDITTTNSKGEDIRMHALYGNNTDIMQYIHTEIKCFERQHIIKSVIDDNINATKFFVDNGFYFSELVYYACFHNSIRCLRMFKNDTEISKLCNINGDTPAHIAASKNNYKCLYILKNAGVDFDQISIMGLKAIDIAIMNEFYDSIRVLAKYSNPTTKGMIASLNCVNNDILSTILRTCTYDLDTCTDSKTLLELAFTFGNLKCFTALLEHGTNPNKDIGDGNTILSKCVQSKRMGYVEVLYENGADLNIANSKGETPAYIAAENNFVECIDFLKFNGAVMDVCADNGLTPLMIAEKNNNTEIIDIINRTDLKSEDLHKKLF